MSESAWEETSDKNETVKETTTERPQFSDPKPRAGSDERSFERGRDGGDSFRRRDDAPRGRGEYERYPPRNYSDDRRRDFDTRRFDDRDAPRDRFSDRGSSRFDDRDAPRDRFSDRGSSRFDDRDAPRDRFSDKGSSRFDDRGSSRFDDRNAPRDRFSDRDSSRRFYDREGSRFNDRYEPRDRYDNRYESRTRSDYYPKRQRQLREDPSEPNEVIGIFNLSYNLTPRDFDEYLVEKLADFKGKFTTKLVLSRFTDKCRGYGFVMFNNIEDSVKAKAVLENGEIHGQKYTVAFSIQKRNNYEGRERSEGAPENVDRENN